MARILYVENHAVFAAHVTKQFLSQHDINVVPSLAAARLALKSKIFDLVLLDYELDDGKGAELFADFRAMSRQPYVVAASAHDAGNSAHFKCGRERNMWKAAIQ